MPYRDDPSQVYYDHDPYAQAAVPPVGEAYAMTQINRTRSPGPQAAYTRNESCTSTGSWCRLPYT
ncbi:hypothetical protein C8Q74DRAFT_1251978 [Fomes fomentarius]|nr:hypothetical protein C8Q74DRAFT_1251978 [Fomes fomentarius]